MAYERVLRRDQRAQLWVGGPDLAVPIMIAEYDRVLIEAPNWGADRRLYVNGDGRLWAVDLDDPGLRAVDFAGLPPINNDHVLDPDGVHVYLSADDGHIHRGALTGGPVRRVTPDDGAWHFLHGVSPDGHRLAYVELHTLGDPGRLAILAVGDGTVTRPYAGEGHLDGPEWSPDGSWIHLNTEAFTDAPGHAQLARLSDGFGDLERLVVSPTVDWFPHLSPDGTHASYLAFPPGTLGHPADLEVEVRVVATSDWSTPLQRYPLIGGQGTLNVNSWSPDGTRFAFVAYPIG